MPALCLGEAIVDLVCERPVRKWEEADSFVPHFGGAVANVAVVAAGVGADVALAGGAGDDAWGHWLRLRLAEAGVDLRWFGLFPQVATPVAFVIVDSEGEPRYQLYGEGIESTIRAIGPRLPDAVAVLRKTIGATDPAEAEAGTVRKLFAESKERNAIHASDSDENAARESTFFFAESDSL